MSMWFTIGRKSCMTMICLALGSSGCGCGDEESHETPAPAAAPKAAAAPATQPLIPVAQALDWCREHGMPESICVQCKSDLAAAYKAKGDWDEKHNLPKSQCFQCDPSLKEKFAAAYKEKYGKAPPTEEAGDEAAEKTKTP